MDNPTNETADTVFDASPYLRLVIDKDCRWFQNGAEIVHPEIYRQFNQMLERTPDGGYRVRLGKEICSVHVEDAPFVVQRVVEDERGCVFMNLNDGTTEAFTPESCWIGDAHVPYTYVKEGRFHARFSRPAYYQLAHYIAYDEREGRYFFTMMGRRVPVELRTGHGAR